MLIWVNFPRKKPSWLYFSFYSPILMYTYYNILDGISINVENDLECCLQHYIIIDCSI